MSPSIRLRARRRSSVPAGSTPPATGGLRPREPLFSLQMRVGYPVLKGFHAPQRAHVKQPMPPRSPK